MSLDRLRIEQLYAEIERKRAVLAQHRADLAKLQSEVNGFAQTYDRIVGTLQDELDAVYQQIEDLQAPQGRYFGVEQAFDPIWGPYGSLEESFDAKYRRGPQPDPLTTPTRTSVPDGELKALYRRLARKYHPDTTTDPAEKQKRTVLMAQINAAYRAKNFKELQALEIGVTRKAPSVTTQEIKVTPQQQTLADLMNMLHKLDDEIDWTKIEQQRLLTSPLMQFKIECSIARGQGRDMLREMATGLRSELVAAKNRLHTLRRGR